MQHHQLLVMSCYLQTSFPVVGICHSLQPSEATWFYFFLPSPVLLKVLAAPDVGFQQFMPSLWSFWLKQM